MSKATSCALSFQQMFYWKFAKLASGLRRLETCALRLIGPLRTDILQKSVAELIRRHDALRTRIVIINDAPRQFDREPWEFDLQIANLTASHQDGIEMEARILVEEFAERQCNLNTSLLFDVSLVRLSESEHLLVWGVHHVIFDAFSSILLFGELWSLYADFLQGRQSTDRVDHLLYADYAAWQHQTEQDWLEKHDPYWQNVVEGVTRLQWPVDPGNGVRETARPVQVDFDTTVLAELRKLAQKARTMLPMVMLGLYALLIAKWCRQSIFVVPLNIAGRHRPEHERMVGYFAQLIYLRIEIAHDDHFVNFVTRVSEEFYRALSHQDFGRVATRTPSLLWGAFFSWLPWQRGEIFGAPSAELSKQIGISAQPYDFTRTQNGADWLRLDGIGISFGQAPQGVQAYLTHEAGMLANDSIERFGMDLKLMAEQLTIEPESRQSTLLAVSPVKSATGHSPRSP